MVSDYFRPWTNATLKASQVCYQPFKTHALFFTVGRSYWSGNTVGDSFVVRGRNFLENSTTDYAELSLQLLNDSGFTCYSVMCASVCLCVDNSIKLIV